VCSEGSQLQAMKNGGLWFRRGERESKWLNLFSIKFKHRQSTVTWQLVGLWTPVFRLDSLSCFRDPSTLNAKFYVLLTVHLGIIFVNNQLDAQFFFMYVYFYSLHVSGSHVPIIRRINCINTTSGICHSYCNFRLFTCFQSDICQMSYWYNSPDDGHMVAQNM